MKKLKAPPHVHTYEYAWLVGLPYRRCWICRQSEVLSQRHGGWDINHHSTNNWNRSFDAAVAQQNPYDPVPRNLWDAQQREMLILQLGLQALRTGDSCTGLVTEDDELILQVRKTFLSL